MASPKHGWSHQRTRQALLRVTPIGTARCAIGGELLPSNPRLWDLAHGPYGGYLGFACRKHNRGAPDTRPAHHPWSRAARARRRARLIRGTDWSQP